MNVQPTDMARIVAPYAAPGVGAVVTVVAPMTSDLHCGVNFYTYAPRTWIVQGWVRDERGRMQGPLLAVGDEFLRRIDPFGGEFVAEGVREVVV